jgi:citrate lyase subunit beta/citryl-CoA lyase
LILTLETAQAMADCRALAACSPRVVSMLGATARDADITRALGYVYTPSGSETLYLRSKVVLACRAAGLDHPVCGLWQDIHDLLGLEAFAQQNRELGYRGQVILHPSHVAPVHAVFTPRQAEVDYYREMVAAFEEAEKAGSGAVLYDGQHIDAAHAKTARMWLDEGHRIETMAASQSKGDASR